METPSSVKLVVAGFLIQVLCCEVGESHSCSPGFGSDLFLFRVPKEPLQRGARIGTVVFDDCGERTHVDLVPSDARYHVHPDGAVTVQRQLTLHDGHETFSVHARDSSGKKHTALVRVERQGQAGLHHGQQEDGDEIVSPQFSKPSAGLRRRKREWLIPPIRIMENGRGPFPIQVAQIKSTYGRETKMVYSVTGEGADLPPAGLFTIDRHTGWLYVSRPLDRELRDKYELLAHAHSATDGIKEPEMKILVEVLNLNDNSPIFTQPLFIGSVPEDTKLGSEFMTVKATDADDGPDTVLGNIRYSVVSQNPPTFPNMFAINAVTGAIGVNAEGLDKDDCPEYMLEIEAADMQGEGRGVRAKAVITVTAGKSESTEKVSWPIPPIRIPENEQGPFPKEIAQLKSSHAKITKVKYILGGSGASLPPEALFFMNTNTGQLFVSRSLDREMKDEYTLQVHLLGENIPDESAELMVHVVDQNDNKPVFTQNPFIGSVSDAAKIGFPLMTISATDADDPNTENADIRYSITGQIPAEPKPDMFVINPVNGVIRVNADGLDVTKYPKYVLKIQAADMGGDGLASVGDAVIHVTDSKAVTSTPPPGIWEISPVCVPENSRGPYPKQLAKIRTNHPKESQIVFHVTGEGADRPPVGLFTVDKDEGWLSVTQPLDRETKQEYLLEVQAVVDGKNEHLTEITICVIDQNDNKPVFTQDPFQGSVPETSKIGFKFMSVSATDADDPKSENAMIRYSIVSQDPAVPQLEMFGINPNNGEIHLKANGLDRQKYPEYTLEIQVADMRGNGLQRKGKAVITVTA